MLEARRLEAGELDRWDMLLAQAENATLFSQRAYLDHLENVHYLGVFDDGALIGGLAVPVVESPDGLAIARASYLTPYHVPLFRREPGGRVRRLERRRAILGAVILTVTHSYASMSLPLHPSISDMVPFQQAHFALELRYTFELDISDPTKAWGELHPRLRNHIRSAAGVELSEDPAAFDLARALAYEPERHRARWADLIRCLVALGSATTLVARHRNTPVGGVLLVYDQHTAYTLLSYYDRASGLRGVPAKLVWEGASRARSRGISRLDLDGSVLPAIEQFFVRFGGAQRPYFGAHWHRCESRIPPQLYYYT